MSNHLNSRPGSAIRLNTTSTNNNERLHISS